MAIVDNTELHRFELDTDGVVAFMTYRRGDGRVTILHTEMPESLAGRGVASELAKGVLDLVRAQGSKLLVKCPFLAKFIAKHQEYQDLLEQSEHQALDARLDEALEESFPDSDSVAVTPKR
jgi:predicted GNAT family acetyltransferase